MLLDVSKDVLLVTQPTNVFLALRPPQPMREAFDADARIICDACDVKGARRPADILHTTLLPVGAARGRIPIRILRHLHATVAMVRFPSFEVAFDLAMSFFSRAATAPFVIADSGGASDIVALHLAIRRVMELYGFRMPTERKMMPHMTLAYSTQRCSPIHVPAFSWRATNFSLIESWTGKTKYVELARWSLWEDPPVATFASSTIH